MTNDGHYEATSHLKRKLAICSLICVGLLGATTLARAQYPSRQIQIIVPWPAGGLVDLPARLLADKLRLATGQPVVVENRVGAGGSLGATAVAKATADGYTLLVTTSAMTMNQALRVKQPFDAITDFQAVALLGTAPSILITSEGTGLKSVGDVVARAKKEPGRMTYASAGNGTPSHLGTEWLKSLMGINMLHVAYKGGPPAMLDLMTGRVDIHFTNTTVGLPQITAGKVIALAVTSPRRLESLPNVPTMIEAGVPNFVAEQWIGLLAPKGAPREVVSRLNELARVALSAPDVQATMTRNGIVPGAPASAEVFATVIRQDLDKWSKVVDAADIKAD